ncbi:hypothetical protein Hanom_Chr05g00409151 [Helianthus anomalus]
MSGSQWPNQTHAPQPKPPTQAPPYPMGVGLSGGGAPIPRVNQYPNPSPTIPYSLTTKACNQTHPKSATHPIR